MQHTIADTLSEKARVTGSPMVDMLIASLVASALLQYLPQITKTCTDGFWLVLRRLLLAFRFSASDYKHCVDITSTSKTQSQDNNDDYGHESAVHSPNTQSTDNLPVILGVLHYFQTHKIHFNSSGTLIGHVQSAVTERTTRDQLHKAMLCFIPEVPIIYNKMRFTFTASVSNGDDQQNDQGQSNDEYNDGGRKKQAPGPVSTMRMTVEGNDLSVIQEFLLERFHEEVDLAYPKPDSDDDKQYMFEMNSSENRHNNNSLMWFRTPFSTNKTFRTVFFEQKQMLIDTINHFQNKTGPWAPERERPNKLVIMLEGLPGTGKSGSIKAIANMTKRHILSINASDLKDDSQVARLFRDEGMHFVTAGQWRNEVLEQNKRILVFDDLDCTGNTDWLLDRKKKKDKSSDDDGFMTFFGPDAPPLGGKSNKRGKGKFKGFGSDDKMFNSGPTLGGLLNVLDGVSELNGQIVILTTNHIDMFDPALYRAGRVDLRITMGYASGADLIGMVECAFMSSVSDEQKESLMAAASVCRWTGSDIQELLQGAKNVNHAVEIIDAKHRTVLERPDLADTRSNSPVTSSSACSDMSDAEDDNLEPAVTSKASDTDNSAKLEEYGLESIFETCDEVVV